MSNPEPDYRQSNRRHRGPIWGLIAIGVFITLMTTAYTMWWGAEEAAEEREVAPIERIDGEITGTVPGQGLELQRDPTPGPVGVAEDPPGVDVEERDIVE